MPQVATPPSAKMVSPADGTGKGKWMALTAALLGWMFDGFEMGLFPLVARPALQDLLGRTGDEGAVGLWFGVMTAGFLVGAATGGVLFGWLGDRIGRVRAMTFSVLAYTLFTGLCGLAPSLEWFFLFRFVASLGMGGEWSLGVALVMEVWKGQSRAVLAGVIGAAANAGYLLVGVISIALGTLREQFRDLGLPDSWVQWRLLMLCGALPALLTFFIRLFVPESESWEKEKATGRTSAWATSDLLAVLLGVGICGGLLTVWKTVPTIRIGKEISLAQR